MTEKKPTLSISLGSLEQKGLSIAFKAHEELSKICNLVYCGNETMLHWALALYDIEPPKDLVVYGSDILFDINPNEVTKTSSEASYDSFLTALALAQSKEVDGMIIFPSQEGSWSLAGIDYKDHIEALCDLLPQEPIIILKNENLNIFSYTHNVCFSDLPKYFKSNALKTFFLDIYKNISPKSIVGVVGLNDFDSNSNIDLNIKEAISLANQHLDGQYFEGIIKPKSLFLDSNVKNKYQNIISLYHEQAILEMNSLAQDGYYYSFLGLPFVASSIIYSFNNALDEMLYKNSVKKAVESINTKIIDL